jgi:hypothetical protein
MTRVCRQIRPPIERLGQRAFDIRYGEKLAGREGGLEKQPMKRWTAGGASYIARTGCQ